MGTTTGALKQAANRAGIPFEEYVRMREAGYIHCCYCKQWLFADNFATNPGRKFGGRATACRKCMRARDQTPIGRYYTYKAKAKKRNYEFSLTFEEFMVFWQAKCVYCGDMVETIGLDRVDNNVGYTATNCVSCCWMCNQMKHSHPVDRWVSHMEKVITHLKSSKSE